MRQRILVKDVQSEHTKMFNDRADRLEELTARVLKKMEIRRSVMFREVRTKNFLEMKNYLEDFDKSLKLNIKKFSDEITYLNTTCDEQCKQQFSLINHLTDKLQMVVDDNHYMKRQITVLKNENKKLDEAFRKSDKRVHETYLDGDTKNFIDNRKKTSEKNTRELKKFKTLYINKCFENEVLEKDNAEMKSGFERYDDYFVDIFLDLIVNRSTT